MPGKFSSGKSGFKESFDDVSNCRRVGKSIPVNCRQHTRVCSFLLLDIGLFGHDPLGFVIFQSDQFSSKFSSKSAKFLQKSESKSIKIPQIQNSLRNEYVLLRGDASKMGLEYFAEKDETKRSLLRIPVVELLYYCMHIVDFREKIKVVGRKKFRQRGCQR